MKIISSGSFCSDDHSVIFTCWNCGCKFKASTDEYYQDASYKFSDTITVNYASYFYTKYHANCPECHKMCHASSGKEDYSYSVTCDSNKVTLGDSTNAGSC